MSTLLVVDIGNTTTRAGVWQDGAVRELRVVGTRALIEAPDTTEFDIIAKAAGSERLRVAISSVVPDAESAWTRWCQESGVDFMVIHGDTPTPLANRYADPRQLGPDRLANAVAAVRRVGAPAVVAGLGTATVVDAVSAERGFLGGAIAVGVETGVTALSEMTAGLPSIALRAPMPEIGARTEDCMRIGAVVGAAALIEGLTARFRALIGEGAPLVLTGGNAGIVAGHLSLEHMVFPDLTLEGIGAIWEYSHGRS
jgi:type III pantothenate kinase